MFDVITTVIIDQMQQNQTLFVDHGTAEKTLPILYHRNQYQLRYMQWKNGYEKRLPREPKSGCLIVRLKSRRCVEGQRLLICHFKANIQSLKLVPIFGLWVFWFTIYIDLKWPAKFPWSPCSVGYDFTCAIFQICRETLN